MDLNLWDSEADPWGWFVKREYSRFNLDELDRYFALCS